MASLLLQLELSSDQVLDYYRGWARVVYAVAADGRTVQFPAKVLQRFVTPEGVHGWFRLDYDERMRLVGMERVDPPR
jgi:hypothetical protein